MSRSVDSLITAYERGFCTRRQLLSALAALGIGGASASAGQQSTPGSSIARINHINLRVSNVARSVEFYESLFGPGFRQFPTMLPYDLGGGSMVPYMSVQNDKDVATEGRTHLAPRWHGSLYTKPGTWEHVALEVDDFDVARPWRRSKLPVWKQPGLGTLFGRTIQMAPSCSCSTPRDREPR